MRRDLEVFDIILSGVLNVVHYDKILFTIILMGLVVFTMILMGLVV